MKNIISKIMTYKFDLHMRELLHGASIAFILKVTATILGMLLNIIITRNLGIEDSGLYFLTLAIITVALTVGRFGTNGILVRRISAAFPVNEWNKIAGIYKTSIILVVIMSLIVTVILYFIAPLLADLVFNKPELSWYLWLMSIAIMPIALSMVDAFALQGLKKYVTKILFFP